MADETKPPEVKAGLKTTEMWVTMSLLGILGAAIQQTIELIPKIASIPNLPGWVPPLLGLAPLGLAWVAKIVSSKYLDARTALKLAPPTNVPATATEAADILGKV